MYFMLYVPTDRQTNIWLLHLANVLSPRHRSLAFLTGIAHFLEKSSNLNQTKLHKEYENKSELNHD